MWDEPLVVAGRTFRSRLVVGSARYSSPEVMRRCHDAAASELVTVPLRRLDLSGSGESTLDRIDTGRVTIVASTADCRTADEAVRTAYLGREAGLGELVHVSVLGDDRTHWPDTQAVLEATRILGGEGFTVLASAGDDPVVARRLQEAGAAGLVVAGAPPGSGLGLRNPCALRILLETLSVPVIVGGGVGTASDAALAMEVGCHAVLVESAITGARDPEAMAEAMRKAVEAGRLAFRAGRIVRRLHQSATGPIEGVPDWTPLG